MRIIVGILLMFVTCTALQSQTMEWVYLPSLSDTGMCIDGTDCSQNIVCYGLSYTPGITGTITSYTTGFFVDCVASGNPVISNESCIMTNSSDVLDDCASSQIILLNCSGNSGNSSFTAGTPAIIHQVCFSLMMNDTITIIEDDITDLSVSLDSINGGGPESEFPSFMEFEANYDFHCFSLCGDVNDCGRSFDSVELFLDTLVGGNIAEGSSLINSMPPSQNLDIYDELNYDCSRSGGLTDMNISLNLINTFDINGNGIIDALGSMEHRIFQTEFGIRGHIPIGTNMDCESSSGDVRGYKIDVDFANHLNISASQITVNLAGINSSGQAYESSSLVFWNDLDIPYGTNTYNGFFNGTTDLSGSCGMTAPAIPWSSTGNGFLIAQGQNTVNLTDPCNPISGGNGPLDITSVNAMADAALDANDKIGGFTFIVYMEDVAAPNQLDDGSGAGPDDGIIANLETTTNFLDASLLLGFDIDGCVFENSLPIELLSFQATSEGKTARLIWETSSEINNDYFSIEWSKDGIHFSPIGQLKGAGNSDQFKSYQFLHTRPNIGNNYYRLKQVDFDGRFSFSNIEYLNFDDLQLRTFNVYPIPAQNELILEYSSLDSDDSYELQIFDFTGRVILDKLGEVNRASIRIPIGDLDKGPYFVKIKIGSETHLKRFIKM